MIGVTDDELATLDLEAQDGRSLAASPRVDFRPAGLSEEVRDAAPTSSAKPRPAAASETNEAKSGPRTGERRNGHLKNGAPTLPLEQHIFTGRLNGWQRTRLLYKSGKLQKMALATTAIGALKQDKVQNTRQVIRAIFDELDSK